MALPKRRPQDTSIQLLNLYCTLVLRRKKRKLRRCRAVGSQTSGASALYDWATEYIFNFINFSQQRFGLANHGTSAQRKALAAIETSH